MMALPAMTMTGLKTCRGVTTQVRLNGEDVLLDETIHLPRGHLPAQNIFTDSVSEVFPFQAALRVVMLVQVLEEFTGFGFSQGDFNFVGGAVNILHRPHQRHSAFPIALQDCLRSSVAFQSWRQSLDHFFDVLQVHGQKWLRQHDNCVRVCF